MEFSWSEKAVLITGASSGLGRGIALELGRRGASIGLLARRSDSLRQVADKVEKAGGQALVLPCDVTDVEAVRTAVGSFQARFGPVDIMVANAGTAGTAGATDLSSKKVADVMNVNVLGAVNCVAAVLPAMLACNSGHLVAISSLAAYRGLPKSGAYCASKAALSTLFESIRLDLRQTGIKVTIIHPGFVKTPLTFGRQSRMPLLMELEEAVNRIILCIEKKRRSCAFPWQLAMIARAGIIMPGAIYDRIVAKRFTRE